MAALRTPSETPERLWSAGMAAALGEELAHLAGQARAAQVGPCAVTVAMGPAALQQHNARCRFLHARHNLPDSTALWLHCFTL